MILCPAEPRWPQYRVMALGHNSTGLPTFKVYANPTGLPRDPIWGHKLCRSPSPHGCRPCGIRQVYAYRGKETCDHQGDSSIKTEDRGVRQAAKYSGHDELVWRT